jgi:hypothetical protein
MRSQHSGGFSPMVSHHRPTRGPLAMLVAGSVSVVLWIAIVGVVHAVL